MLQPLWLRLCLAALLASSAVAPRPSSDGAAAQRNRAGLAHPAQVRLVYAFATTQNSCAWLGGYHAFSAHVA